MAENDTARFALINRMNDGVIISTLESLSALWVSYLTEYVKNVHDDRVFDLLTMNPFEVFEKTEPLWGLLREEATRRGLTDLPEPVQIHESSKLRLSPESKEVLSSIFLKMPEGTRSLPAIEAIKTRASRFESGYPLLPIAWAEAMSIIPGLKRGHLDIFAADGLSFFDTAIQVHPRMTIFGQCLVPKKDLNLLFVYGNTGRCYLMSIEAARAGKPSRAEKTFANFDEFVKDFLSTFSSLPSSSKIHPSSSPFLSDLRESEDRLKIINDESEVKNNADPSEQGNNADSDDGVQETSESETSDSESIDSTSEEGNTPPSSPEPDDGLSKTSEDQSDVATIGEKASVAPPSQDIVFSDPESVTTDLIVDHQVDESQERVGDQEPDDVERQSHDLADDVKNQDLTPMPDDSENSIKEPDSQDIENTPYSENTQPRKSSLLTLVEPEDSGSDRQDSVSPESEMEDDSDFDKSLSDLSVGDVDFSSGEQEESFVDDEISPQNSFSDKSVPNLVVAPSVQRGAMTFEDWDNMPPDAERDIVEKTLRADESKLALKQTPQKSDAKISDEIWMRAAQDAMRQTTPGLKSITPRDFSKNIREALEQRSLGWNDAAGLDRVGRIVFSKMKKSSQNQYGHRQAIMAWEESESEMIRRRRSEEILYGAFKYLPSKAIAPLPNENVISLRSEAEIVGRVRCLMMMICKAHRFGIEETLRDSGKNSAYINRIIGGSTRFYLQPSEKEFLFSHFNDSEASHVILSHSESLGVLLRFLGVIPSLASPSGSFSKELVFSNGLTEVMLVEHPNFSLSLLDTNSLLDVIDLYRRLHWLLMSSGLKFLSEHIDIRIIAARRKALEWLVAIKDTPFFEWDDVSLDIPMLPLKR